MSNYADNKRPDSATTSESKPADNTRETEFLDRQVVDARAAIDQTLARMRETLKQANDLKGWAREYPWATVGAAAAAGFLAAKLLAPRRHRSDEPSTLLHRVLADDEIAARLRELADSTHDEKPRRLGSLASTVMKMLAGTLESAIVAAVTAQVQSAANPQPPEPQGPVDDPTDPEAV
jgi:ElaB/YqjD/DUF883 family membrane-anchored ribosome-binding protein